MLGLWFKPEGMIKGFTIFGKGVVIVATIGLVAGAIQQLTGLTIIPGIAPIGEGIEIVGGIALVLAGAFCLVLLLQKCSINHL